MRRVWLASIVWAALALTVCVRPGMPVAWAESIQTPPVPPQPPAIDLPIQAPAAPRIRHHRHAAGEDRVTVGGSTDLPAGQSAGAVVSVLGSSSVEGSAHRDVVSVLGSTHVTGSADGNAVAVLGNTDVDGHVGGDVVAVLGDVRLGPHAIIDGDVTSVGGRVLRDPMAIVQGQVQQVGGGSARFAWAAPWVRHGAHYLRPLAWAAGLVWVWVLTLLFLALYVCLALLFPEGIECGVQTLERHPGRTVLTALIATLLTPVLLLLLVVTLIGIAAVPLVLLALVLATLFGKAALLAWIGQRLLGQRTPGRSHVPLAVCVLVGGVLVMLLYLVPVLGLVLFEILGLLGLGLTLYTLIDLTQARRRPAAPLSGAGTPPGAAGVAPAASPSPADIPASAPAAPPSPAALSAPAAPVPTGPFAGFWIRMGALLIDALLVGIVVHLLPFAGRLELLGLGCYGAVMWKLRGTTLGGIVFNLQVVRLDGRPLDWSTALVRALGCFLSLAVVGLGFFWIAFDASKQAWHDKFAGTVVLRVARVPSLV